MIESMTAWVVAAMAMAWTLTSKIPGDTPKDIAAAIATASVEKPLFANEIGPRETASLMTGTARYESGFRQVKGDCKGLPPGDPRCGKDGTTPTSFCFMQVHLPDGAKTAEGWTGEDLMTDPLKCARAAREIMRLSIKVSPAGEPLNSYAGDPKKGDTRFQLAKKLLKLVPWMIRCD
jgi:hypothetical protein